MEGSLWNLKVHKTRGVIEFIDRLEPLTNSWKHNQIRKFNIELEKAKNCSTANEMLEIVGYMPNKRPKLYDKIEDMEA